MCLPGVRAVLPGHDVPAREVLPGELRVLPGHDVPARGRELYYQAMMCLPGVRAVLPGHDVPARGESRTTRP